NNEGLILRWSFDETTGTTAQDVSGGMHPGTYTGMTGAPTPSTNVPKIGGENPRSRAFTRANRHAVQLANMPDELKPINEFTAAARVAAQALADEGVLRRASGGAPLDSLVHWRVDDANQAVAAAKPDVAYSGTYRDPPPSLHRPRVSRPNPRSRRFTRANRANV